MNKKNMMFFSALMMSCFLSVSAGAKSIEKDTYRVCKNDIFIDYDQLNCKKIVTEIRNSCSRRERICPRTIRAMPGQPIRPRIAHSA